MRGKIYFSNINLDASFPRYTIDEFNSMEFVYSILHEAKLTIGDTEGMDEKWSPGIGMESLLASLVSVLHTPNLDSPANVDAKILYSRFSKLLTLMPQFCILF